MAFEIKPLEKSELEEVAKIENACFTAEAWPKESFEGCIEDENHLCLVAKFGEKTVGYLICSFVLDEMNVDSVAVSPDFRRQGIAKMLIEKAIEKLSPKEAFLEVRESNIPARKLYSGLGFEEIFIRKDYYSLPTENAVIMKLEIN